jgi:RNA polymerase sigma-70 factor (ECF subfamily)
MISSISDDADLLAAFADKRSKNKAFECILDKYQKRLYWHVRRILIDHDDADDAVQNTFIKVWEQLDSYRGDSKLYTWLYRVATNEALQLLKKKKVDRNVSMDDEQNSFLTEALESGQYFDGNKLELKLQSAILTLPEKQRIVFNLKYYENMKYEEMSQVLDTSVGALKASYFHAVKKIEHFFEKELN